MSVLERPAAADRERPLARSAALSLRSRFDLVFDIVLLIAFGIAYTFDFTGIAIHEWFGLAFGLALLLHITLHWDWVVRTTRNLFSTAGRRRLMWLVNLLLLFSFGSWRGRRCS